MVYYRVYPQYDGTILRGGKSLIANELFTATEVRKYGVPSYCTEIVEISKKRVYASFGVRLEMKG